MNGSIRSNTGARQWRSTQEVTSWFTNIEEKDKKTFVKFDIVEFYPSITESTFIKAIEYAREFETISNDEMKILLNARESFICMGEETWAKKGQKTFDCTLGSFDGAEVAELVGLLLLKYIKPLLPTAGLYRDDGLAVSDKSGPQLARLEKDLHKLFKDFGFQITVEVNLKRTDFLDTILDLNKGRYGPFRKENDTPMYVHKLSNHPPSIIKALPKMISSRLSSISSTEEEFKAEVPMYQKALREAGYNDNLEFSKPEAKEKKKNRSRKVVWFNPPFSKNVATNLTAVFRNLLAKHFKKGTLMGKLFNKNNCKLSYSTMPNMDRHLTAHNTRILKEKEGQEVMNCNCAMDKTCPLDGKCMDKGIVYEARVHTMQDNVTKTYVGSAATTFKARWYNHKSSFTNIEKKNQTSLSTYIWKKKEEGMQPAVSFSVLTSAPAYTSSSGRCSLCLQEKVFILLADRDSCLNKKSEVSNKCRHKHKWTLEGWKPGTTS